MPTMLYVEAVWYDSFEDDIFVAPLMIQKVDIQFYNEADRKLDDLKSIKFSGRVENTSQGSILLGAL